MTSSISSPETPVCFNRSIHYEIGDSEKAREELEKVIKAVPDNLLANKLLGDIYRESGRHEDALKRYGLVQMLTPADAEVAASIRKIEEYLSSKAPVAASEAAPPAEALAVPAEAEEEGFSSAPTRILSREDLRSALPPEVTNTEVSSGPSMEITEEPPLSTLLKVVHPRQPARYLEDEEAEVLQEDSEREEADELTTQTLADIYIQQGLPDKAIKVYQKMLLKDPGNIEIFQRLREINPADALLSAAGREEPARSSEMKVREPATDTHLRSQDFFSDVRRRKISTLESWLAAIRRERA